MSRKDRPFEQGMRQLASWFERQRRILPWRENPDTYRVWISEIMLQQTQVATVIPYFEKFMNRFPSLEALARAPEEEVLLHWAGLGYYSRARNIHRAAGVLLEGLKRTGRFPSTREQWLDVPGVGPYTAGAILSISMDLPEAILDGNVERVISRLRRVRRGTDAEYKKKLWRLSRAFVERAALLGIAPSATNQALMELGATVCLPRSPRCELCPLEGLCRAREAGEQESFPPRKKPRQWIEVRETLLCCIDARGQVLLSRRAAGEWRAGLWDLPEPEKVPELVGRCTFIGEVRSSHVVTRHRITRTTRVLKLKAWRASEMDFEGSAGFRAAASGPFRWVAPDLGEVPMGSALKKTLSLVRESFPGSFAD